MGKLMKIIIDLDALGRGMVSLDGHDISNHVKSININSRVLETTTATIELTDVSVQGRYVVKRRGLPNYLWDDEGNAMCPKCKAFIA